MTKLTRITPGLPARRPLYRRRWFWAVTVVLLATALAAAAWILSKDASLTDSLIAKSGKIEVKTNPDQASIFLDGKDTKKKSNSTIRTKVGQHKIKLQLATYDEQEVTVDVKENQTAVINHIFTRDGSSVLPDPKAGQAELKTYTNQQYGYTIQYPSAWEVDTDQSGVAHFSDPRITSGEGGEDQESMAILVQPNPDNLSPEQWYKSREEYQAEDQAQIAQRSLTVNGRPGYQYDTPYGFVASTFTVVTGKGYAYLLQNKQGSPDRKTYDQIIQTFTLL